MSVQPLEARIAYLEGAFAQMVERIAAVERAIEALRTEAGALRDEMHARFADLDRRVDQKFMWMIGLQFTSWMTIMLAIFFKH